MNYGVKIFEMNVQDIHSIVKHECSPFKEENQTIFMKLFRLLENIKRFHKSYFFSHLNLKLRSFKDSLTFSRTQFFSLLISKKLSFNNFDYKFKDDSFEIIITNKNIENFKISINGDYITITYNNLVIAKNNSNEINVIQNLDNGDVNVFGYASNLYPYDEFYTELKTHLTKNEIEFVNDCLDLFQIRKL